MGKIDRCNILGVGVSAITMDMALAQIKDWIAQAEQHYVCVADVNEISLSQRSPRLHQIHNQAGMVTPDGMPLVWVSRWMGYPHVSRVYGPDLLLAVCQQSLQTGWSHYFYGGSEQAVSGLVARLSRRFPNLKVAGYESPPYRPLTPPEDLLAVERINASGADIVWVGLGAPKQDYWMAEHLGKVRAPVMIGIGAAFDFHAGLKKQAPRWMQRSGLEWLFRLASEPRRLWKRYLVNNPVFLARIFLQLSGLRKYSLD